jgi:hypothetical protein
MPLKSDLMKERYADLGTLAMWAMACSANARGTFWISSTPRDNLVMNGDPIEYAKRVLARLAA